MHSATKGTFVWTNSKLQLKVRRKTTAACAVFLMTQNGMTWFRPGLVQALKQKHMSNVCELIFIHET